MLPPQGTAVPRHVQTARNDSRHTFPVSAGHDLARVIRGARPDPTARLRRQARAAIEAGRPVAWLARALYALDAHGLKGTSANTGRTAAVLAASADFRSGRRARPGRLVSAELLGVSERTIERHWRLLERVGAAEVTTPGRHLSADEHAETRETEGERTRWRDRQEWRLLSPACLDDVQGDVDLTPYELRAAELLGAIAGGNTRRNVRPVDNRSDGLSPDQSRVAPSRRGSAFHIRSSSHWFPPNPKIHSIRPNGRVQGGGAPRHSPTKKVRTGRSGQSARRMPVAAVELARDVLSRGRMPWLYRSPRPMLAAALSGLASCEWTARDVETAVHARLAAAGVSSPSFGPARPVAYLRWLLADVDPDQPPAQARDARSLAAAGARSERTVAERAAAAVRFEQARAARGGRAHRHALAAAPDARARAAARRAADRAHDDAARAASAAAARAPRAPLPALDDVWPAASCDSCGTTSTAVAIRTAIVPPAPLCGPCWEAQQRLS